MKNIITSKYFIVDVRYIMYPNHNNRFHQYKHVNFNSFVFKINNNLHF